MDETAPTERELDVLKVLWTLGESKVRDVHQALSKSETCAFTTVQTLLRIMAEKGLVRSRAEGRTLYYAPVHTRGQVSARFLRRVFDGALDKLVLNLVQAEDVSPEELQGLERLIADARRAKEKE